MAVVGESHVGKTSMCSQLTSDGMNFPKNYLLTHLMEVRVKAVNIPDTNNVVELYLNDCSGKGRSWHMRQASALASVMASDE